MAVIQPGKSAPSIVLPDQDRNVVNLASLRGKRVLLSFHPLAWTSVCRKHMEALEATAGAFSEQNTIAFGISVDPVPCKKAWADAIHVHKTTFLSDFWPHGAAAQALGLFRESEGTSERANVLIDETGTMRFVKVYPMGEVPDMDEIVRFLKNLRKGE